jgi:hypothetical protein
MIRSASLPFPYRPPETNSMSAPAIARGRLAFGTTAVAAGVVGDPPMGAAITLLDMTAQSGSPTDPDVSESLPLPGRHGMTPAAQELLSELAKDIGHF